VKKDKIQKARDIALRKIARKNKPKEIAIVRKLRGLIKKKHRPDSLAWHKAEWAKTAKSLPDALLAGLAQLSYENARLRARVAALEAFQIAQMFGTVEIRGDMHLLECAKRDSPDHTCTCGSTPDEEHGN
jgi:hypothetical protein